MQGRKFDLVKLIVVAAALSAAVSHPPNRFVNNRFVSMCPPRQAQQDLSTAIFRGDPPWARNVKAMGPISRPYLVNRAVDRFGPRAIHTCVAPHCHGGFCFMNERRIWSGLANEWVSRGGLFNEGVDGIG